MSRSNITIFLIATFSFSYLLWMPSVLEYFDLISLGGASQPVYFISLLVGAFGPAFGAAVALSREDRSIKQHFKRVIDISGITVILLLTALFLPILINGMSIIVGILLGLEIPPSRLPSIWLYLPNLVFVMLLGGGQEEIGWRGYLQEQTDEALGSNTLSSIFIGFFWGLWHIPLWFMIWDEHDITPFLGFIIMTMTISIVYGKLYRYSSNNMLLMIILHGSSNAVHALWYLQYLDEPSGNQPLYWVYVSMNVLVALVFVGIGYFRKSTEGIVAPNM